MSRAEELDKAIIGIRSALNNLEQIKSSPVKTRTSLQAVSTQLNIANGRLASIMHARFSS